MNQLEQLKRKWVLEDVDLPKLASDEEILHFQSKNNVIFPEDLLLFFKTLNGTQEQYDGSLFQFYSICQLKSIKDEYKDWKGIPNFQRIVYTLKDSESYYTFANQSFHLFAYAIKLYNEQSAFNEVLVVCGDEYKKIANSFSEFIDLYLNESIELQLNY